MREASQNSRRITDRLVQQVGRLTNPRDRCRAKKEGDTSTGGNAEDFPRLLSDPGVSKRVQSLGIRYVIVSQYGTFSGTGNTSGAIDLGGWAVGTTYTKSTNYSADVYDMSGFLLGRLATSSSGKTDAGVIFLLWVIPIPIYVTTPTESYACSRLGRALAGFLWEAEGTLCAGPGSAYGSCTYTIQ